MTDSSEKWQRTYRDSNNRWRYRVGHVTVCAVYGSIPLGFGAERRKARPAGWEVDDGGDEVDSVLWCATLRQAKAAAHVMVKKGKA